MNKFSLALALGAGVALSSAAPSAQADPIIQSLPTASLSASQFSSLFQPIDNAPAQSSTFQFLNAPVSGVMESQVFKGADGTAAQNLYAYAYQVGVNNVTDGDGNPVSVQSASWKFNATPVGTDFTNTGHHVFAYTVSDGTVGGLTLPQAAPGQSILTPAQLAWQPNTKVGSLVASYVDPAHSVPALNAGGNSATFVVISDHPFSNQFVNIQSPDPQTGSLTQVYAATGGSINPVPVPEPTTVLAWAGMAGAFALVRRVRKNRPVV
jgi:hypothetical protein